MWSGNREKMGENKLVSHTKRQTVWEQPMGRKLYHQFPNEGSLNCSSGTHNRSFYHQASAIGLRSTTLMVIDGAHSVGVKYPFIRDTHTPQPHNHTIMQKHTEVSTHGHGEGIKCHKSCAPVRFGKFSKLCFVMCEYPESQAGDRREGVKKHLKSSCIQSRSLSCMCRCRLKMLLAKIGSGTLP